MCISSALNFLIFLFHSFPSSFLFLLQPRQHRTTIRFDSPSNKKMDVQDTAPPPPSKKTIPPRDPRDPNPDPPSRRRIRPPSFSSLCLPPMAHTQSRLHPPSRQLGMSRRQFQQGPWWPAQKVRLCRPVGGADSTGTE